jgi:3-oxoadipate enol-lactonase
MPFVQTEFATLFVTEAGPAKAPPILFSNSLGTTHRMWDAIVAELASEYRCIRYDTRGHGASTCADQPFSIHDLARDAVDILDNLDVRQAHFVGLSLGGMTGQSCAIHHGERLASLSLLATTSFLPPASAWEDRAKQVRAEGMTPLLEGILQRWFTSDFRSASPHHIKTIASDFIKVHAGAYALCCEAIAHMDLRHDLPRIKIPTLIIAGADDPATPVAMSQSLQSSIAGSELTVLSPAAHLLAVEQPEKVAAQIAQHIRKYSCVAS